MRSRSFLLLLLAALLAVSAPTTRRAVAADGVDKIGEFRPFAPGNKLSASDFLSVVDQVHRTWFMLTGADATTGTVATPSVYTFALDGPRQVGAPLALGGTVEFPLVGDVAPQRGVAFFVFSVSSAFHLAAVASTPTGPRLVGDWDMSSALAPSPGTRFQPSGLRVVGDKGYLAADPASALTSQVRIVQFDVGRVLAGQNALDWTYDFRKCQSSVRYATPAAVGKSVLAPVIVMPCRATRNDLHGVSVLDIKTFTPSSTNDFTESYYPISGDFGTAESFFDPRTDRIAMRRTGPAQLVVFDARHRRWMRPLVSGQNNLYQSAIDETSGRVYGTGDDPGAESYQEFLYIPELRPTPPQNGLTMRHLTPSPSGTQVASGRLAIDEQRSTFYVADVDVRRAEGGELVENGLFFHVYRDSRPAAEELRLSDADKDIINLSAESQGYGARVSYVGGIGSSFSNALVTQYPPQASGVVAQGTRHLTFARTLRARLSQEEASATAMVGHPEGATDAEFTTTGEHTGRGWPYTPTSCRDFGGAPAAANDSTGKAHVECDVDYPKVTSAAVYEADNSDPYNAPVQRAATASAVSIHATKGVVTTVTSEGSLNIPGVLAIGNVRATATTLAAGKKGTAESVYSREMRDVTVAGQPVCTDDCDPEKVAARINSAFSSFSSNGILVVASVPRPDPTLLHSPGGVQAIVQQDLWDHEEDVGINDGSDENFAMPAFVVAIYQDRRYPQHEVYSLAAVQAVSRLPSALADRLSEIASPDPDLPTASLGGGAPSDASIGDTLSRPVGPAGSTLSAPRRRGSRRPSGGLTERIAWTVESPFRSPAMLAILAFLAVPVYLSSRRWLLLSYRPAAAGDSDAD